VTLDDLRARALTFRSWHFVPGASEKMLARAASLDADALILDLEDSVAPADKPAARERVAQWLDATPTAAARIVRINPLATEWGAADLAMAAVRADAVMAPKIESLADLRAIDERLAAHERETRREAHPVGVAAIATETPRAVFHLDEIARGPRLIAITWGAEDLSAAIGASSARGVDGRYLEVFRLARSLALLAAASAGIAAVDGVYTRLDDDAGLRAEADEAAAMGFLGKLTIHPRQIAITNAAFEPAPPAVAHARELVAAYAVHAASGRGAFSFGGEMIDAPHLARAQALLARAARRD